MKNNTAERTCFLCVVGTVFRLVTTPSQLCTDFKCVVSTSGEKNWIVSNTYSTDKQLMNVKTERENNDAAKKNNQTNWTDKYYFNGVWLHENSGQPGRSTTDWCKLHAPYSHVPLEYSSISHSFRCNYIAYVSAMQRHYINIIMYSLFIVTPKRLNFYYNGSVYLDIGIWLWMVYLKTDKSQKYNSSMFVMNCTLLGGNVMCRAMLCLVHFSISRML